MKKREEEKPVESGEEFEAFEEWEGAEEEPGAAAEEENDFDGGFAEEEGEEEFPAETADAAAPEHVDEFEEAPAEEVAAIPESEPANEPRTPPKFDRAALDLAPDVPVQVIAVIGKRSVTIKELMELRMGQVIDLKRPPSETVDVVVNGKLFARGELVEIDGKLGVKILKLVR